MTVKERAKELNITTSKAIRILEDNGVYRKENDQISLGLCTFIKNQLERIENKVLQENSIEEDLIESIIGEEITGLTLDFAEIALDNFLDEDLLQEIPIFGTLVRAVKVGKNIDDKIFAKKVYKFLFELKNVPQIEREEFIKKIDKDPKYETKIGEKIITILNRADDYVKATMMGKLLKACLEKKIDYDTFQRLTFFLNKLFSPDIYLLQKMTLGQKLTNVQYEGLSNTGLIQLEVGEVRVGPVSSMSGRAKTETRLKYKINEFGRLIVEHAL